MSNFIEHELRLSSTPQAVRSIVEDAEDHPACALVFGGRVVDGCLIRIHSRCLYGDVFHSSDCDCREQLDRSMELIQKEGSGVIIYLDQEGRGHGLASKAKGYVLTQTKQLDTYKAYKALGLEEDIREYDIVIEILRLLGLNSIRLLTNNPSKIVYLETAGIRAERVPIVIQPTAQTKGYLGAKKNKGHLL